MDDSSQPPLKTLFAAAVGGFGGALLGVAAATSMMGDGDAANGQAANPATDTQVVEMAAADHDD